MVYIETSLHENTSWSIDGEHTAVVAVAELELAGKGSNAILIFDHSRSMKKDDGAGYSSSFEALYHCLIDTFLSLKSSRDFLRPRAKSPTRIYSVVTLISMSDTVTVEIHTIRTVAHTEARDNQQSCTALARQHIAGRHKELEVMTADTPDHSKKRSWKPYCHPTNVIQVVVDHSLARSR